MAAVRTRALLLAAGVGTVAVYVGSFAVFTTKDRPDQIDTPVVVQAATDACIRLRLAVDALPPLPPAAPLPARRARVAEQVRLVEQLEQDVRAVGPQAIEHDRATSEWLADWQRLADARTRYVADGGQGPFRIPVVDGRPVTDRMAGIGVAACQVPDALTASP